MIEYSKKKIEKDNYVILYANPISVDSVVMKEILEELEEKYVTIQFFIIEKYSFKNCTFIKQIPTIEIYKDKKLFCNFFGIASKKEIEDIFDKIILKEETNE